MMERFKEYFDYNPETGVLKWIKKKKSANVGDVVDTIDDGYLVVQFDKIKYRVNRLVWFLHYGVWPEGVIDHINRNKEDNRIENLRDTTIRGNTQNRENFKFGCTKVGKKWRARVHKEGKELHLGYFTTEEEAMQSYRESYHDRIS